MTAPERFGSAFNVDVVSPIDKSPSVTAEKAEILFCSVLAVAKDIFCKE